INRTGRYVRVQIVGTMYLVLGEVQVWTAAAKVNWLVADQLGTPRMLADLSGSLAGISGHDYLPYGEEVPAGLRNGVTGYSGSDSVRQKFTSKERDNETGLDYFLARYYSSTQGRFTSVDPTLLSVQGVNPQTWNRYCYVSNNPLRFIDPLGLWELDPQVERDKNGHIKAVNLLVKKSKDGDNAGSLVKQLGIDPSSKAGQKLVATIEKQLGSSDKIQLSKMDGMVGKVYGAAEHGLTAQAKFDEAHPDQQKTNGPTDLMYNDCSMTCGRIALGNEMQGVMGGNSFGVTQMDEKITALGLHSVNGENLQAGDIIRYATSDNAPRHFMNMIFTGDDGTTQAFSRSGVNGRFEIIPVDDPKLKASYGSIRGINRADSGFYRSPQ
ncbi:MAG: repeat-associated core domain protein, partial [Acidobacteria bacterium]|nr:repeat-associated core domain protein [Acidobacteriota bacterium]